jgi:hypothetical protein
VTGGDDQVRSPEAARQAAVRERRAAAKMLTQELLELGRQEARQVGLPLAPATHQDALVPAPAKGGRPAGSVARKTAEWAAYMLARYRSPLVVMAETFSRPTRDLAEELSCTPLEAFELQMKAAAELAPYVHSKQPTGLQLDAAPDAPVMLAVSPALAARMGMATEPREIEGEAVEDQGLGGGAAP